MDAQRAWLRVHHPEVFKEQKHLDTGSPERAYWHHGYMAALADLLRRVESENDYSPQPVGQA